MDYSQFLLAMLLKDTTTEEYEEMPYDLLFVKALELHPEYSNSEYNDPNQPEYECIESFLQDKITFKEG